MTLETWKDRRDKYGLSQENNPGVFHLAYPYGNYVCIVDKRNPVGLLNDYRDIPGAILNTVFEVEDKVLELMLDPDQGLQKLIYNKSIVDIAPGEQLFCDYGEFFWTDNDDNSDDLCHTIQTACTLTADEVELLEQNDGLNEEDDESDMEPVGRQKKRAAEQITMTGASDDDTAPMKITNISKRQAKKNAQASVAEHGSETDPYEHEETTEKTKLAPRQVKKASRRSRHMPEEVYGMEGPGDLSDSQLQVPSTKKQVTKAVGEESSKSQTRKQPEVTTIDSEDEIIPVPSGVRYAVFMAILFDTNQCL